MSKKDFLSVPTPGGLAPLNPNPIAMGTASATGNYLSDICNFKVLCIFKILHFLRYSATYYRQLSEGRKFLTPGQILG